MYIKNKKIGIVYDVKNHGAGDYLEIIENKKETLVPLQSDHVLEVDLGGKKILLNPKYYEI